MITYRPIRGMLEAFQTLEMIRDLDAFYPDFTDWWINKVIPGVVVNNDPMIVADDGSRIIGLACGKVSEKKLRCLRVASEYKDRGIGIKLIERILPILGTDRPAASIPEERVHDFSRILVNRFDFKLDRVEKGLYRKGKLEYFFNGIPAPRSSY